MKQILRIFISIIVTAEILKAQSTEPYSIEVERINMPGTPAIHSFAFAQSGGKWLFIGGRTNGLHGFDPGTAFPKQYSNKNIFVVDPASVQTWSRNIFQNLSVEAADPLRSTNMQYVQDGNKLYINGGYGYDSTSNGFITFPVLTVVDVSEVIQAIINGTSVAPYIRQLSDSRLKICGGELKKLGDYFYLMGGHNFNGLYSQTNNDQVYSNQIRKFKIIDNGVTVSISDYSAATDTMEYHRRDMNVVNAIKNDDVTPYLILYGGVFLHGIDLPYLNPIYVDANGAVVDNTFQQKMSQYTCAFLNAYNQNTNDMHTTLFGGMSLYYYNENTHQQERDSLVPFINDITTVTRHSNGNSEEKISATALPALLGTNARFILDPNVPHYDNEVVKLNLLSGRTFAGYIYGGIRALLPNNTPSFPSDYVMKVYITPTSINISHIGSSVPEKYELMQNYPNPFNPSTKIRFNVPASSDVKLTVFDNLGRRIAELVNQKFEPGVYETQFDGYRNGMALPSGVYYYKLEANSGTGVHVDSKAMIMMK